MDENLIYAQVAVVTMVVALACLDTAITGEFRPFRNSKKSWPVSKRWRSVLAVVGVIAAVLFLFAFHRLS